MYIGFRPVRDSWQREHWQGLDTEAEPTEQESVLPGEVTPPSKINSLKQEPVPPDGKDLPDKVFVLTIRLSDQMDYELAKILHAIGDDIVSKLTWGIEALDWLGSEEASQFNAEIDKAPGRRIVVSGQHLLELSEQVWQTIEGEFVGYRATSDAHEFLEANPPLSQFATSPAEIAIEVKDGCFADVYLRSRMHAVQLAQRFRDVSWRDPADFTLK
jgi:hypothetical protein